MIDDQPADPFIPAPIPSTESAGTGGILTHEWFMDLALRQARRAGEEGEVPVGAVLVKDGRILGKAYNMVEQQKDPTAHAEILAITQAASALGDWRLEGTVLYVTKEPCVMCAGAIILARIPLVVWGLTDPQRGGAVSLFQVFQQADLNHRVAHVAGVREAECRAVLQEFFRARRREARTAEAPPAPEG